MQRTQGRAALANGVTVAEAFTTLIIAQGDGHQFEMCHLAVRRVAHGVAERQTVETGCKIDESHHGSLGDNARRLFAV